jgi:hypothetical protein
MLQGYLLNDYLARKTEFLQERWTFEVDYTSSSPKVSKGGEWLRTSHRSVLTSDQGAAIIENLPWLKAPST